MTIDALTPQNGLRMLVEEFTRLRNDFAQQASRYSDETLTIYFLEDGVPPPRDRLRQPNHVVALWQYMVHAATDADIDRIGFSRPTRFGLTGALLSAFGALEGQDTPLFRRMAFRAGSIVPQDLRDRISILLMHHWMREGVAGKPVLATNSHDLAVWLNLVLTCMATFQPARFRGRTLAVDPFAASIPACEFILSNIPQGPLREESPSPSLAERQFQVALSFAEERREFVAQVANELRASGVEVFYDRFHEAELAQLDMDVLLQRIYHDNSALIVLFVCRDYERKEWCGLEWRALRDLIKKRRGDSIMPMRFDLTEVPGLFSIDGYVDLRNRSPQEAVSLIRQRLLTLSHERPAAPT